MKKLIALLVIGLCSAALAAVSITITVSDVHIPRVIAMMDAWKGANIHIEVRNFSSDPNEQDYSVGWNFSMKNDPNETSAQYAERFIKTMIRECVKAHEYKLECDRVKAAYHAISPPDVNVPDEVIQ